ncbi:MAG: MarP family serine protease [Actinomycetota bacterium]|nr:MarP family serine protease [Actinomycetota bacterium]
MNLLDLAIVAVLISSVVGGWQVGLFVGATAWVMLAQGLVAATLVLPVIDRNLGRSNPGAALMVEAIVFISAGFAGLYVGRYMGRVFRAAFLRPQLAGTDRRAGAIGGPVATLLLIWLIAIPAMTQSAGFFARQTHHSLLARGVDAVLPPAPDTSRAFHRLLGPAGMPQVFASLDPLVGSAPPPATSGLSAPVQAQVSASTVKVDGMACGRRREGSGFAVGPDLVVTNAHVVAGEDETSVLRPDGTRLAGEVTAYDSDRDLAILTVPGLGLSPLGLASPEPRSTTAVFGHPDGQDPLRVAPALIRREMKARGYDLYGDHLTSREVLILAAALRPGDSGSAVVDTDGAVVGVAFAISLSTNDLAFALNTSELKPLLAAKGTTPVSTGDCLS